MKKFLAIMLALILVLANVAALAEVVPEDPKGYKDSAPFSFSPLPKNYEVTGASVDGLYPQETLEFTVIADGGNPDGGKAVITVGANQDNKVAVAAVKENNLQINVPELSMPGLYHFTVTEKEGNTQGVTYDTSTEIGISVLVTFSATDASQLEVLANNFGVTAKGEDKVKVDEIVNEYDLGSLTVSKSVTGNLGDRNQLFDIKVTFEADGDVLSKITVETESTGDNPATIEIADWKDGTAVANIQLKHDESLTFKDIPAGVSYTVEEDAKHSEDDPNGADGSKGYDVTYEGAEGEIKSDDTASAAVKNDKNLEIDTGVNMETLPYVMIMALAVVGIALLVFRKKEEY